ncbi:RND family transporter [Candidatus Poribacteria bacterium]|nr:RND family transporter [Candidatus Poribacteria bacterium]
MDRIFKSIAQFPKMTILAVVLATAAVAIPMRSLRFETDVETMMPEHHPVFIYNKQIEKIFNTKKMIVVGIVNEGPHGVFNPKTLKLVEQLSAMIEDLDGIIGEDIVSLQTLDNIVGSEGSLEVIRLMETAPETQEEADELRMAVLDNDMFVNNVVSPDGTATSIFAKIEEGYNKVAMYDHIKKIVAEEFDLGGDQVFIAGRPVIEGTIGRYAAEDMRRTFPLVTLVSLIVLYLTLRSARGVFLPLAVVVSSVVWTLGIMSLARIPMYAVTTVVPVFLIAVGLAYGIHIINRYNEEAASAPHGTPRQIVLAVMHEIWAPVTMAALTTAAGFLSLATSDMMPIRYFGIFTGIGVFSALVFSLTFIPAWLMILPIKCPKAGLEKNVVDTGGESRENGSHKSGLLTRSLRATGRVIGKHPAPVLAITAIVALVGFAGLLRVYVDGSLLSNFRPGCEVLTADTMLNEKFGGTNTLNIIVDGKNQDDMKSPEILCAIERLQHELEGMDEVGATLSIADYLKRMNRVMNENHREYSRIPDSRELIAQYLLLYSLSGDPDDFDDVVDYDYRLANVRVRVNSDSSPVLKKVLDQTRSKAMELFRELPVSIHPAGGVMTSYTFMNLIIRGQLLSILSAIVAVFLITALMFRSAMAGFFCIIPVMIATLLNFSLMGATGIPLGVTTAILSGMGIGIGVDYAIHFVAKYRWLADAYPDRNDRLRATMQSSGRAIFFNAIVVTAGFLVLMISNFPPSRWLSALVSANMVSSLLGALTVLPACLAVFKPKFADKRGEKKRDHE